MKLTISEKIKMLLKRHNMTITELSEKLGTTRQNMTNKFARDNFLEKELIKIADILNCFYEGKFTINDTGDII